MSICISVLKPLQSTLNICETFYWTDSSIVLSWVINKDKIYKTYVQQPLIQIREFISDFEKFKLVTSKLNPADLGTKNLSPKELFSNKLWFSGPHFLSLPRNCWPHFYVGENFSNNNIDNSSINLVDGESLILPSSCTQSNVNNVNNLNLVAKEELLEDKSACLISTFDKNFGLSPVIDITNYSSYWKLLGKYGEKKYVKMISEKCRNSIENGTK